MQLDLPVYKIVPTLLPDLERRLERLDRKARQIGGFVSLAWWDQERHVLPNGSLVMLQQVTIKGIIGDVDSDWTPAARLEIAPGANIIHKLPTYLVDIPVRFRTTSAECDRCHLTRPRKHIWVFHNKKTDEYAQAGSACAQEFAGSRDIKDILKLARIMLDVERIVSEQDVGKVVLADLPDDALYYDLKAFLCRVVAQIEDDGHYIGRGEDPEFNTANQALYRQENVDEHLPLVQEALDWMFEAWGKKSSPSDYEHNMLTIYALAEITYRHIGYAASLMAVYYKHLAEAEVIALKPVSKHFGQVKKRYKNQAVKVVWTHCYGENDWGSGWINKFEDVAGHVFVWFTGRSLVEGEDYIINFTVKDYGEYNNILQTEVTRCHIVSGPEEERSLDE